MTRVETLREQAYVMRALARSFELPLLRDELLLLAKRCEELAKEAAREVSARQSKPIDPPPSG